MRDDPLKTPVFAAFGQALVAFGQSLGLTRDALLRAALVSAEVLDEPDGMMEFGVLWRLWRHLSASFPHEPLGMRYARQLSLEQLGLVGYLIMHSPTPGEGLRRFMRFQRIVDPLMRLELRSLGDATQIVLRYDAPLQGMEELMEMFLGSMCYTTFAHHAALPTPQLITMAHARRHPLDDYESYFRAPVRFEQPEYSLTFDRTLLDQPSTRAVAQLGRSLERDMERLMALHHAYDASLDASSRRGRSPAQAAPLTDERLAQQVRAALAERLHRGEFSQPQIARALAMSQRTLQRKLSEQGTTFAALLAQVRHDQARYLLGSTPSPVYEIAFLLGYQDAASFYRAFKQWSGGLTPEAYRLAASGTPEPQGAQPR